MSNKKDNSNSNQIIQFLKNSPPNGKFYDNSAEEVKLLVDHDNIQDKINNDERIQNNRNNEINKTTKSHSYHFSSQGKITANNRCKCFRSKACFFLWKSIKLICVIFWVVFITWAVLQSNNEEDEIWKNDFNLEIRISKLETITKQLQNILSKNNITDIIQ